MNESGKTSLPEALANVYYFDDQDVDFRFDMTHDYPRKQKKTAEKSGQPIDAVKLSYEIDDSLRCEIEKDVLLKFKKATFLYTKKYNNYATVDIEMLDTQAFIAAKLKLLNVTGEKYASLFSEVKNQVEFDDVIKSLTADGESAECLATLKELKPYLSNDNNWDSPICCHI